MARFIRNLFIDDDGAVTIDWVVLTAAIVGLGLMVIIGITNGMETKTAYIADTVVADLPE